MAAPTKTDNSIGRVLVDRPRKLPPDLRYDVPAETFERLKDAVIVNHGRSGAAWEWNREDLTELDTSNPIQCEDDLGNESGSAAASLETDDAGQSVIRLTATSLRGTWLLPVLESVYQVAAYPRGVVIEARLGALSNTSIFPVFGVASDDAGGDAQAVLFEVVPSSTTTRLRAVLEDGIGGTDTLGSDTGHGTIDDDATSCGVLIRLELWMSEDTVDPDGGPGDTVLGYRVHADVYAQDGHAHKAGATGNTGYINISAAATEPMDKIVIGFWAGTAQSGTVDFSDLRVFAHPMDRS